MKLIDLTNKRPVYFTAHLPNSSKFVRGSYSLPEWKIQFHRVSEYRSIQFFLSYRLGIEEIWTRPDGSPFKKLETNSNVRVETEWRPASASASLNPRYTRMCFLRRCFLDFPEGRGHYHPVCFDYYRSRRKEVYRNVCWTNRASIIRSCQPRGRVFNAITRPSFVALHCRERFARLTELLWYFSMIAASLFWLLHLFLFVVYHTYKVEHFFGRWLSKLSMKTAGKG